MKAITIRQPFAGAIAAGLKCIETRPRRCLYRGDVAIHAATTANREQMDALWHLHRDWPSSLHAGGAILCVAELCDCLSVETLGRRVHCDTGEPVVSEQERALGDYRPGRFGLLLRNVRVLREPVPCRGRLGLWTLPPDIEALVRERLP